MISAGRYERTRYASPDQRLVDRLERQTVWRLLRGVPAKNLLDIPSGYGRFTSLLSSFGGRLVAGDRSLRAVMRCRERAGPGAAVFNVVSDAARLPFRGDTFDLVFCFRLFHHVPWSEAGRFLKELARVSRRWVLISCYVETGAHRFLRRAQRRGSKIYFYRRREVLRLLSRAGLRVFAVSRPLPFFHAQTVFLLEKRGSGNSPVRTRL